jgi:hypothetical protein
VHLPHPAEADDADIDVLSHRCLRRRVPPTFL